MRGSAERASQGAGFCYQALFIWVGRAPRWLCLWGESDDR